MPNDDTDLIQLEYTPKAATVHNATEFQEGRGIHHAVIIQPSVYGYDNSALIDALRFFKGQYRGVAVVDPDNVTDEALRELHDVGVRGLRLNFINGATDEEILAAVEKIATVAEKFDWAIELWGPLQAYVVLHEYIMNSNLRFVADHFAQTRVGSWTNNTANTKDPYRTKGFSEMVDLVKNKRLFVKLSGPYRNSKEAPLYEDMRVVAETIIFNGPEMVVYGSDWPHTGSKEGNEAAGGRLLPQNYLSINDAAVTEVLRDWLGDEKQWYRTMVDNPIRLWGAFEDDLEEN